MQGENDMVVRAEAFATHAHTRIDQRRKYTNAPYVEHLSATAKLVASVTNDFATLAAAWLHDSVEDTSATIQDLEKEFGAEVATLVAALTDVSTSADGNRAARKEIDRVHLSKAPAKAKTVKLADLINNCVDISANDARFARTYLVEMEALLGALEGGEPRLMHLALRTLARCNLKVGRKSLLPQLAREPLDFHAPMAAFTSLVPRLFIDAFCAKDIATPLRSFDAQVSSTEVLAHMQIEGTNVVGIRKGGRTIGFVNDENLGSHACGDKVRQFGEGQVVGSDALLVDLIQILTRQSHCFVTVFDDVGAIVSRSDMNKPIVRMWLFGLITIVEMYLTDTIRAQLIEDDWQSLLSIGRLEKALSLFNERRRRGVRCDLVDCLQLGDKADVLRKDVHFMGSMGFKSQSQARQATKELESLRNSLAHGQDVVINDWAQIARLARMVEGLTQRGS